MDELVLVDVINSLTYAPKFLSNVFEGWNIVWISYVIKEITSLCVLHDNVNLVVMLKIMVESDNVRVYQLRVDRGFSSYLLNFFSQGVS